MNLSDPRSTHYLYETQHNLERAQHNNLEIAQPKDSGAYASYYELPRNCQLLLDIIVKRGMCFIQGEIFKACYRWDKKPDLIYNLEKIIFFAEYLLRLLRAEDPSNPRGNHER